MEESKNFKNYKQSLLYIVPTPIGNFSDISARAISVLKSVDLIIAENIYHTINLLKHFYIKNKITKMNINNELYKSKKIINILKNGTKIALVSNAGTPVISDPGYNLINLCYQNNIQVIPLPGPCAAITALSASGLPTNNFCFEGFLPFKKKKDVIN